MGEKVSNESSLLVLFHSPGQSLPLSSTVTEKGAIVNLEALSPFLSEYGLDVVGVGIAVKLTQYLTNFIKRPIRVIFGVPSLGKWSLAVAAAASVLAGVTLYDGATAWIVAGIVAVSAIGAHETTNGG